MHDTDGDNIRTGVAAEGRGGGVRGGSHKGADPSGCGCTKNGDGRVRSEGGYDEHSVPRRGMRRRA